MAELFDAIHELQENVENLNRALLCSICLQKLTKAVHLRCAHYFCKDCITPLVKEKSAAKCPLCSCAISKRGILDSNCHNGLIGSLFNVIQTLKEDFPLDFVDKRVVSTNEASQDLYGESSHVARNPVDNHNLIEEHETSTNDANPAQAVNKFESKKTPKSTSATSVENNVNRRSGRLNTNIKLNSSVEGSSFDQQKENKQSYDVEDNVVGHNHVKKSSETNENSEAPRVISNESVNSENELLIDNTVNTEKIEKKQLSDNKQTKIGEVKNLISSTDIVETSATIPPTRVKESSTGKRLIFKSKKDNTSYITGSAEITCKENELGNQSNVQSSDDPTNASTSDLPVSEISEGTASEKPRVINKKEAPNDKPKKPFSVENSPADPYTFISSQKTPKRVVYRKDGVKEVKGKSRANSKFGGKFKNAHDIVLAQTSLDIQEGKINVKRNTRSSKSTDSSSSDTSIVLNDTKRSTLINENQGIQMKEMQSKVEQSLMDTNNIMDIDIETNDEFDLFVASSRAASLNNSANVSTNQQNENKVVDIDDEDDNVLFKTPADVTSIAKKSSSLPRASSTSAGKIASKQRPKRKTMSDSDVSNNTVSIVHEDLERETLEINSVLEINSIPLTTQINIHKRLRNSVDNKDSAFNKVSEVDLGASDMEQTTSCNKTDIEAGKIQNNLIYNKKEPLVNQASISLPSSSKISSDGDTVLSNESSKTSKSDVPNGLIIPMISGILPQKLHVSSNKVELRNERHPAEPDDRVDSDVSEITKLNFKKSDTSSSVNKTFSDQCTQTSSGDVQDKETQVECHLTSKVKRTPIYMETSVQTDTSNLHLSLNRPVSNLCVNCKEILLPGESQATFFDANCLVNGSQNSMSPLNFENDEILGNGWANTSQTDNPQVEESNLNNSGCSDPEQGIPTQIAPSCKRQSVDTSSIGKDRSCAGPFNFSSASTMSPNNSDPENDIPTQIAPSYRTRPRVKSSGMSKNKTCTSRHGSSSQSTVLADNVDVETTEKFNKLSSNGENTVHILSSSANKTTGRKAIEDNEIFMLSSDDNSNDAPVFSEKTSKRKRPMQLMSESDEDPEQENIPVTDKRKKLNSDSDENTDVELPEVNFSFKNTCNKSTKILSQMSEEMQFDFTPVTKSAEKSGTACNSVNKSESAVNDLHSSDNLLLFGGEMLNSEKTRQSDKFVAKSSSQREVNGGGDEKQTSNEGDEKQTVISEGHTLRELQNINNADSTEEKDFEDDFVDSTPGKDADVKKWVVVKNNKSGNNSLVSESLIEEENQIPKNLQTSGLNNTSNVQAAGVTHPKSDANSSSRSSFSFKSKTPLRTPTSRRSLFPMFTTKTHGSKGDASPLQSHQRIPNGKSNSMIDTATAQEAVLSHALQSVVETPKVKTEQGTRQTPLCIACSLLGNESMLKVKRFTDRFKLSFSRTYTSSVTHLIVPKANDIGKTIKLLFAIAQKRWVVFEDWVDRCLELNELVNEEDYEAAIESSGIMGPRRSRLSTQPLFKGYSFYFFPPFTLAKKEDLEKLVQYCGGKVEKNPEALVDSARLGSVCFILVDETNNPDVGPDLYEKYELPPLRYEFIADCIANFEILDTSEFLLVQLDSSI